MKIFLNCEEAGHTCDKLQYKESSILEWFKLQIHIVICAACRKHTARNSKLTRLIKKSKLISLPREEKEKLKLRLQEEMSK